MSLEITVLRLLKHRGQYEKLARSVPERAVDARTQTVLADYGRFFRETGADLIQSVPFTTWFKLAHPRLRDEDMAVYGHLFKQIDEDVEPGVAAGINERLIAADTAARVADLLQRWNDGDEVDLLQSLRDRVTEYEQRADRKPASLQVLDPIEDLLAEDTNDWGLHYRLPCMNEHSRPLRPGDAMIVAARPNSGKTTWMLSEATYMAGQFDTLWPGEKRSVLWMNNEGKGGKIVKRAWQAALGATIQQMADMSAAPAAAPGYTSLLRQRVAAAFGGRLGAFRVFNVHDKTSAQVESILAAYAPGLIVFDMVDNIRFSGMAVNGGQRTDQILEEMYKWARNMGVKYDCPVMSSSQLSADAHALQWPSMPQLKDSKTGKQAACDIIVTIGKVDDPNLEKSRYIGMTKNKNERDGIPASPRREVIYDGARARYVEAP